MFVFLQELADYTGLKEYYVPKYKEVLRLRLQYIYYTSIIDPESAFKKKNL